jgi:hypothetical protein
LAAGNAAPDRQAGKQSREFIYVFAANAYTREIAASCFDDDVVDKANADAAVV